MFDFLRNWRKSAVERQQEMLHAYVDEALSPAERRRFEEALAADDGLQAELAQIQQMKTQLRQLPRRRVPRNFMLDPAVYGRPQRQPLFQLYPVMRAAMALTAFFFIFAIAADLFTTAGSAQLESASAPENVALLSQDEAESAAEQVVEVEATRMVVEEVAVEAETVIQETAVQEAAAAMEEPVEEVEAVEETAEIEPIPAAPEEDAIAGEAAARTTEPPAADAATGLAGTAPSPSPTPSATRAATFAATEPADASPRVTDDEDTAVDRVVTETSVEQAAATAVPIQPPLPGLEAEPGRGLRSPWRPVQIGLGALLLALATAVWYVRRHS